MAENVGNGVGEGKAVSVGRSGVTVFLGDAAGMSPRIGGLVEIGGLVKVGAEVKGTEVLVDGTKVAGTTVSLAEGPGSVQDKAKISTNVTKTTKKVFRLI